MEEQYVINQASTDGQLCISLVIFSYNKQRCNVCMSFDTCANIFILKQREGCLGGSVG